MKSHAATKCQNLVNYIGWHCLRHCHILSSGGLKSPVVGIVHINRSLAVTCHGFPVMGCMDHSIWIGFCVVGDKQDTSQQYGENSRFLTLLIFPIPVCPAFLISVLAEQLAFGDLITVVTVFCNG